MKMLRYVPVLLLVVYENMGKQYSKMFEFSLDIIITGLFEPLSMWPVTFHEP